MYNSVILIPPCDTFGDSFSVIGMLYFLLQYYNKVFFYTSNNIYTYYHGYFSKSEHYNKRIFLVVDVESFLRNSEYSSIHVCDVLTGTWTAPSNLLIDYKAVDKSYYFNDMNPLYNRLAIDQKYICMPNTHLPPTEIEINHLVYYKFMGLNNSVRMDFFDYTRDLDKEKSVIKEVFMRHGIVEGEKYNIINTAGDTSDMPLLFSSIKNNYKCIDIHNLVAFPGWTLSLIENAESIHLVEGSNVNFIYHCQYKNIVDIKKPVYFHVWARNCEFSVQYKLQNAWTMMTTPKLDNWVFLMTKDDAIKL